MAMTFYYVLVVYGLSDPDIFPRPIAKSFPVMKDVKNPHTMQILTAVFDSRKWCIEGRNPWPLVQ